MEMQWRWRLERWIRNMPERAHEMRVQSVAVTFRFRHSSLCLPLHQNSSIPSLIPTNRFWYPNNPLSKRTKRGGGTGWHLISQMTTFRAKEEKKLRQKRSDASRLPGWMTDTEEWGVAVKVVIDKKRKRDLPTCPNETRENDVNNSKGKERGGR